jgi:hypothetical protein
MTDQFPEGLPRIVRQLQIDVAKLTRDARIIAGTPITRSSGPFFLPDSSAPDTPAGGVYVYANGGGFRIKDVLGTVRSLPAADVSDHTVTSSSVSNPPTQSQVNAIRTDVINLSQQFNNLLTSLRNAGWID